MLCLLSSPSCVARASRERMPDLREHARRNVASGPELHMWKR